MKKINEDLKVNNPQQLQKLVKQFVKILVDKRVIGSYNRPLTSGQMNSNDFVEEISDMIYKSIQREVNNANIKGDKYIQKGIE